MQFKAQNCRFFGFELKALPGLDTKHTQLQNRTSFFLLIIFINCCFQTYLSQLNLISVGREET